MSTSSTSDGMIVTETKDGRRRVYRDLSRRSSHRDTRRSNNTSSRSSADSLAPPASPSVVEVRPTDADPLMMSSGLPRQPSWPPTLPPEPTIRFTPDGTAVYERQPATPEQQRPSAAHRISEPGLANRRPSLSVWTSNQRSNTSSPMSSSPGLSNLPKLSDIRRDSARDLPLRDTSGNRVSDNEYRSREAARESARLSRANSEAKRRREEAADALAAEERRLARLQQDRYAARDRARAEEASRERRRREDASRERRRRDEESRERHLRATRDALEGELATKQRARDLDLDERLAAELHALDIEKDRATTRRSQQEQALRDAERSYSPQATRLPIPTAAIGGGSRYASASPVSPRGTLRRTSYGIPALHQDALTTSSRRPSDVIRDRGRAVIEREQAKDLPTTTTAERPRLSSIDQARADFRAREATLGLQDALGARPRGDRYYEGAVYEERRPGDGYVTERETYVENFVSDGPARREERRARREERRDGSKAEFWR